MVLISRLFKLPFGFPALGPESKRPRGGGSGGPSEAHWSEARVTAFSLVPSSEGRLWKAQGSLSGGSAWSSSVALADRVCVSAAWPPIRQHLPAACSVGGSGVRAVRGGLAPQAPSTCPSMASVCATFHLPASQAHGASLRAGTWVSFSNPLVFPFCKKPCSLVQYILVWTSFLFQYNLVFPHWISQNSRLLWHVKSWGKGPSTRSAKLNLSDNISCCFLFWRLSIENS